MKKTFNVSVCNFLVGSSSYGSINTENVYQLYEKLEKISLSKNFDEDDDSIFYGIYFSVFDTIKLVWEYSKPKIYEEVFKVVENEEDLILCLNGDIKIGDYLEYFEMY